MVMWVGKGGAMSKVVGGVAPNQILVNTQSVQKKDLIGRENVQCPQVNRKSALHIL